MHATVMCHCGKLLDVDDQHHGQRAQCPTCGNVFVAGDAIHSTNAVQAEEPIVTGIAKGTAPRHEELPQESSTIKSIAFPWLIHPIYWAIILVCVGCGGLGVLGYFLTGTMGPTLSDVAHVQVKSTLTLACEKFFENNKRWPETLEELTRHNALGFKYLETDAIRDPWHRPYQYDPKRPKNQGNRPDIWTVTPGGTEIGNWPRK